MHNQDKNIQQKIQHLDELPPGFHFNAAKSWNELEAQLQPKNNKRKWFSIAAIFLVIASTAVSYLLVVNTGKTIPGNTAAKIIQPIEKKQDVAFDKSTLPAPTAKEDAPSKKRATANDQQKNIATNNKNEVIDVAPVAINEPVTASIIPVITETAITNTATANVVPVIKTNTAVQKPKLRVVHLNDLYKTDITEIAKAETKRQQPEAEAEAEPVNPLPARTIYKSKATRIAISLTDNQ